MKPIPALILLLSTAFTGTSQPTASAQEGFAFVRAFFAAFDARDYMAIEKILPGATLVHHDGVEVTVPEVIADLHTVKNWVPRTRTLSDFEAFQAGDVVVVGCRNHVVFHVPDGAPGEATYKETWVLQRTSGGLRAIRAHYSRVTAQQHTEGK